MTYEITGLSPTLICPLFTSAVNEPKRLPVPAEGINTVLGELPNGLTLIEPPYELY